MEHSEDRTISAMSESTTVVERDEDQRPALLLSIHEEQLADTAEELVPDFWYLWSNGS